MAQEWRIPAGATHAKEQDALNPNDLSRTLRTLRATKASSCARAVAAVNPRYRQRVSESPLCGYLRDFFRPSESAESPIRGKSRQNTVLRVSVLFPAAVKT